MSTEVEKGTINKEVYFEIIMPKSSFLNYRLGITKVVAPGVSVLDVWDMACNEAEEWHKRKHPELYKFNDKTLSVDDAALVAEIEGSDTIQKLGRLKGQLNAATKPYYTEKAKSLTNNFETHE